MLRSIKSIALVAALAVLSLSPEAFAQRGGGGRGGGGGGGGRGGGGHGNHGGGHHGGGNHGGGNHGGGNHGGGNHGGGHHGGGHHGGGHGGHHGGHGRGGYYGRGFGFYASPYYGGYGYNRYYNNGYYNNGYYGSGYSNYDSGAYVVQRPANVAFVEVRLPTADAEYWLQGVKQGGVGLVRRFQSPEIDPARTFVYTVTAAWHENGRLVTSERRVDVRAGASTVVDFTQPPQ